MLFVDKEHYVPDLLKDPMAMFFHRTWDVFWGPITFVIPAVIGGLATWSWQGVWLGFLWGGLVRVFLVHHMTWSVTSFAHMWGWQDFDTDDHSRNNPLCGVFAFGDGWHNNHHAFPRSAKHGLRWWQFDPNWMIIRTLEVLGLAWNVHVPSNKAIEKRREKFRQSRQVV